MSRYDIERFDPAPDPDLVCCICQSVLDTPLETPCRHVFCKVCIETWLNNRQTCPSCRKQIHSSDLTQVMPIIRNMINRLLIKCVNHQNGCIRPVVLEANEKHEKDCGFQMMTCKYEKCSKPVLRKDKNEHEQKNCDFREIQCEKDCGLYIPIGKFPGHDCIQALKDRVNEQNEVLERLRVREQELNDLKNSLENQLATVQLKLDEAQRRLEQNRDLSSISYNSDDSNWSLSTSVHTEYTPPRSSPSPVSSPAVRANDNQEAITDDDGNMSRNDNDMFASAEVTQTGRGMVSVEVRGSHGMVLRRTRSVSESGGSATVHAYSSALGHVITHAGISSQARSETSSSGIASIEGGISPASDQGEPIHTQDSDSGQHSGGHTWTNSHGDSSPRPLYSGDSGSESNHRVSVNPTDSEGERATDTVINYIDESSDASISSVNRRSVLRQSESDKGRCNRTRSSGSESGSSRFSQTSRHSSHLMLKTTSGSDSENSQAQIPSTSDNSSPARSWKSWQSGRSRLRNKQHDETDEDERLEMAEESIDLRHEASSFRKSQKRTRETAFNDGPRGKRNRLMYSDESGSEECESSRKSENRSKSRVVHTLVTSDSDQDSKPPSIVEGSESNVAGNGGHESDDQSEINSDTGNITSTFESEDNSRRCSSEQGVQDSRISTSSQDMSVVSEEEEELSNERTQSDDNDQSESDDSYKPSQYVPSDQDLSSASEAESDSSYEVRVPKTCVQLLDEYTSDGSDDSYEP